jgi:hypothetical protein
VATIQVPSTGSSVISVSSTVTFGCDFSRSVTASAKGSRSTASAPPAGRRWRSAISMISPPACRISQCRRPTAFCSSSSERKELEHTISARLPVRWAKVPTLGRISWMTTGMPRLAACHAASDPAMPPPTICKARVMGGGIVCPGAGLKPPGAPVRDQAVAGSASRARAGTRLASGSACRIGAMG